MVGAPVDTSSHPPGNQPFPNSRSTGDADRFVNSREGMKPPCCYPTSLSSCISTTPLFTLRDTTLLRSSWVVYREMLHQNESPITPWATTLKLYSSAPGNYEGRENLRGQHDSLLFLDLSGSASNHRPTSVRPGLHFIPTPRCTTCGVPHSNWKAWLVFSPAVPDWVLRDTQV